MKRTLTAALALLLVIVLAAWCPWITPESAARRVQSAFTESWANVADGCGFNCAGCGVTGVRKTLFGAEVQIEYDCGLKLADEPGDNVREQGFVSFLGTVHGLSRP